MRSDINKKLSTETRWCVSLGGQSRVSDPTNQLLSLLMVKRVLAADLDTFRPLFSIAQKVAPLGMMTVPQQPQQPSEAIQKAMEATLASIALPPPAMALGRSALPQM